ncbi:MAG: hypothetical protein QMC81_11140 [Thermoanaerobacterales bacterium]|nr:hypothetical protein [Thermoanaerobacterales bacterium]
MWVGVDVCNTLANVNLELLRRFNIRMNEYPAPIEPEWFASSEGLRVLWAAEPFPGAAAALARLVRNGYRLVYVSSRPKEAEFITLRWLEFHGFPEAPLCLLPRGRKVILSEKARVAAFFEDNPQEILTLKRAGVDVIVKDWPYNRAVQGSARFKAWREVAGQAAGILCMD